MAHLDKEMFISVKDKLPITPHHRSSGDKSAEWDMSDLLIVYTENNDKNDEERVYFLARYVVNSDGTQSFLNDENYLELNNVQYWAPLPKLSK